VRLCDTMYGMSDARSDEDAVVGNRSEGAVARTRDRRWHVLVLLCTAQLMIVLDATVVTVALPSIQHALGFQPAALSWVINAYLLAFGGFLILAGRVGDVLGRRRVFGAGLLVFTAASLGCALAGSPAILIAARAVQGLGGAAVSAVGLAIIATLFEDAGDRRRAMGIFSFVAVGGNVLGVLIGGILIQSFGWPSIFVINLPIGVAVLVFTGLLLEHDPAPQRQPLDAAGAGAVTASVMLALMGCVNAGTSGWASPGTLGLLGGAILALTVFAVIEARASAPVVPLRMLRAPGLAAANLIALLVRAAMFGWFYFAALYMRDVLGLSAFETGLGFLPGMAVLGIVSLVLIARIIKRFGPRVPLLLGAALMAAGLASFVLAPTRGQYAVHVLPGMLLLGAGGGLFFAPLMLIATTAAGRQYAGVASALVNTAQQLGGALGLAVLTSLAASRTHALEHGQSTLTALTSGYHLAFLVAAALAIAAIALGSIALPRHEPA
jgi:EmrB/QacA subfamily drug resistance transporter